jgi:hypothetical protein
MYLNEIYISCYIGLLFYFYEDLYLIKLIKFDFTKRKDCIGLIKPKSVASDIKLPIERSKAGIVGSYPIQAMDIFVRLFCVCGVLCVGSDLAMSLSPSKESY